MIYLSTQSVGNLWFLILRGKQKAEKIKKTKTPEYKNPRQFKWLELKKTID